MERAEALKERLLSHPQVPETAVGLWRSLRQALTTAMDDPDSYFYVRGDELLAHLGRHLVEDEAPGGSDSRTPSARPSRSSSTPTASELAEVISVTVDRWDGKEASDRIELHVGRDLQFIRINGTIVGALAGLLIHALSQLAA